MGGGTTSCTDCEGRDVGKNDDDVEGDETEKHDHLKGTVRGFFLVSYFTFSLDFPFAGGGPEYFSTVYAPNAGTYQKRATGTGATGIAIIGGCVSILYAGARAYHCPSNVRLSSAFLLPDSCRADVGFLPSWLPDRGGTGELLEAVDDVGFSIAASSFHIRFEREGCPGCGAGGGGRERRWRGGAGPPGRRGTEVRGRRTSRG
ncbi:hypothetical protein B0H19DRAFT_1058430 [Mycena capillaripes]|nr:hypothetical protein B0H19DRAFT_1058430 [Mycena capillaripes]